MRFLAIIVLAIMLYGCAGQPYYSQVPAEGGRCNFSANSSKNFSFVLESKEPFSFRLMQEYPQGYTGPVTDIRKGSNETRYEDSLLLGNGGFVFWVYGNNEPVSLYANRETECSGES